MATFSGHSFNIEPYELGKKDIKGQQKIGDVFKTRGSGEPVSLT
jgi:hypothetical protein